jgi:hypothetical protein
MKGRRALPTAQALTGQKHRASGCLNCFLWASSKDKAGLSFIPADCKRKAYCQSLSFPGLWNVLTESSLLLPLSSLPTIAKTTTTTTTKMIKSPKPFKLKYIVQTPFPIGLLFVFTYKNTSV